MHDLAPPTGPGPITWRDMGEVEVQRTYSRDGNKAFTVVMGSHIGSPRLFYRSRCVLRYHSHDLMWVYVPCTVSTGAAGITAHVATCINEGTPFHYEYHVSVKVWMRLACSAFYTWWQAIHCLSIIMYNLSMAWPGIYIPHPPGLIVQGPPTTKMVEGSGLRDYHTPGGGGGGIWEGGFGQFW